MTTFEYVEGSLLAGHPRFSLGGRSFLLGPYDSPASHDMHFAETFGSGDPILDGADELRFSGTSGHLLSCRLRVPENPTQGGFVSIASRLPILRALPRLPLGTHFQFPAATQTEIDDAGDSIAIYRGTPDEAIQRIQIALDFEMVIGVDQILGFVLHNPSDWLVSGWGPARPPIGDRALARGLAQFVNTLSPEFVERLDDGDSDACNRLKALMFAATHLRDSPQRDVLLDSIASVQEIFCAPPI